MKHNEVQLMQVLLISSERSDYRVIGLVVSSGQTRISKDLRMKKVARILLVMMKHDLVYIKFLRTCERQEELLVVAFGQPKIDDLTRN